MDCGGVFVKYVLFIFNILFVVCGILLITFGSIMVAHISELSNVHETVSANSVPIAILVLGCIIFIISFLGCCGAIRENSCCTMTYSVFMLILFVCQLAIIVFVWSKRAEILHQVELIVKNIWDQHKIDQKVMDTLQLSFNCCGEKGFIDYGVDEIPLSCCGVKATSCSRLDVLTKPGCTRAVVSFWEKNTNIIRYAGLGVAAVELIAFIFGCCLANQVRNSRRRANY